MNRFEFLAGRRVRADVTVEDDPAKPTEAAASPETIARVTRVLEALRKSPDPSLSKAASISLGRLVEPDAVRSGVRKSLVEAIQQDPNGPIAWASAEGLEGVADGSTIPFMHRSAGNEEWPCSVRVSLAMSMPVVPDASEVVQSLLSSLIDPKQSGCMMHVSMGALVALGESGDTAVREPLEAILADREARPDLRALAVTSLSRQGPRMAGVLLEALGDHDPQVRRCAALGLGVLGWRSAADRAITGLKASAARRGVPLSAADADLVRELEVSAKIQRGALDPAVRETVKRLAVAMDSDRDHFVQSMAAISIGRIAGEAESALAARVLDRDLSRRRPVQREYDILALALAHTPSAFDAASAALRGREEAPTTRGAGAIALGLLGDERGKAVLREALGTDVHPTIRGYIALALGMLGDRLARADLRRMVERERSPHAVAYAALGLSLVGRHADAEAIVRRLAETSDELVAANLVHALRLMGDRGSVADLLTVVESPAAVGRSWAAVALGYATASPDVLPRRLALARGFNYLLPCGPLMAYFYEV